MDFMALLFNIPSNMWSEPQKSFFLNLVENQFELKIGIEWGKRKQFQFFRHVTY